MEHTAYFSLNLPEYNDPADIADINSTTNFVDSVAHMFADELGYGEAGSLAGLEYWYSLQTVKLCDLADWYSNISNDLGYLLTDTEALRALASSADSILELAGNADLVELAGYSAPLRTVGKTVADIYGDSGYGFSFDLGKLNEGATLLGYIAHNWTADTETYLTDIADMYENVYIDGGFGSTYFEEDLQYLRDVHGADSRGNLVTLAGYSVCEPLIRWPSIYSLVYDDDDKPYVELNVSDIQLHGYAWHDNMYSLKEVIDDLYNSGGGGEALGYLTEAWESVYSEHHLTTENWQYLYDVAYADMGAYQTQHLVNLVTYCDELIELTDLSEISTELTNLASVSSSLVNVAEAFGDLANSGYFTYEYPDITLTEVALTLDNLTVTDTLNTPDVLTTGYWSGCEHNSLQDVIQDIYDQLSDIYSKLPS